ncbi:SMODS domain-containing nucleotidyltransferase [[Muricauda] lutisoli]|uniref:Adenylyl/Guanylyl and SMODS C-terminal sensor domain-containing protein n=1 Tax=[Muricauda] lutisoli TaxID=2816035 RepID=A0ABS3EUK7_9FLAO|nr:nucleotidyltransferase [[Muricauda] lutisoli]MBO0329845.1 hypothetical protein [[Muricauda] lutisoli]
MNTSETFKTFVDNLKISNKDDISYKYNRITKALNKSFYNELDSSTIHSLQVGSYGRKTAIDGISDLDMIFEISDADFKKYDSRKHNGQSDLLQDTKKSIQKTYSNTDIRGDGQVVVVDFNNYVIEVCPANLQSDNSYKYPDSKNGGSWKITKPRQEISELNSFNQTTSQNLKNLCKMTRTWKNKNGVKMGGLLIDTFCYNFLKENENHHSSTYSNYDELVRDFFQYMSELSKEQKFWYAPGSNQKVYKKSDFHSKAKKAFNNAVEAIDKKENKTVYGIWRKIYGYKFPYPKEILENSENYTDSEEFIENQYPVDIKYNLNIDCLVKQQGFRDDLLSRIKILRSTKKLKFYITENEVPQPYQVKWKVKNLGPIAKRRNMFRGQILNDKGKEIRNENSNFNGEHYVECYIIKNGVCVATDRIDVPISM